MSKAINTEMGSVPGIQEVAFYRERIRNARRTALFRAIIVSAFVANNVLVTMYIFDRSWVLAQTVMLIYAMLSWIILAVSRQSERVAITFSLAIPFLDMPIVFALFHLNTVAITAEVPWTPYFFWQSQTAIFSLLIVLSMFSLMVRNIVLAASVAILLSICFAVVHGLTASILGFSLVLIGSIAASCLYGRHRIIALVSETVQQQVYRDRLRRFFSPEVARAVEEHDDTAEGVTKVVTVLVSDLRGFTALSNRLDSADVVEILNDYFTIMVEQIFAHGGTLDKFMGDGILAYFGAPLEQPDHCTRAVNCAIAMQQALNGFNEQLIADGRSTLQMGIGLHTGKVTLGAIGPPGRREFTVIGETVNLAARIEALTKDYQTGILFSEQTRRQLGSGFQLAELPPAVVRGVARPVPLFQVVDRPSPAAAGSGPVASMGP